MLDAPLIPEPKVSRAKRHSPGPASGRTWHSWLREGVTSNSPPAILAQLKKLEVLREMGVGYFDLSMVNHNRLKSSSLLVSRLHSKPRKSSLTRAIKAYGRLRKTMFLLKYMEDVDLRRRIHRQLNKGEELHALRKFLFFANEGNVRKHQLEHSSIPKILAEMRFEGYPLNEEDFVHLSPTRYGHINPYGRYHFDLEAGADTISLLSSHPV